MDTVRLGELRVSAQGLGCMGMSEWYGPADWDTSVATVHRALELGVTFLDTANVYGDGHNEVLVGRAIAGRRDEVQLATKFGIDRTAGDDKRVVRGERGYVKRACGVVDVDLHTQSLDMKILNDLTTPRFRGPRDFEDEAHCLAGELVIPCDVAVRLARLLDKRRRASNVVSSTYAATIRRRNWCLVFRRVGAITPGLSVRRTPRRCAPRAGRLGR